MRYSNRNAKALAVLSAAATLAVSVQVANAQKAWVNPNTGNWSTGANWNPAGAPASGATTTLTFNATGAQTYTATNDLGAFTLQSIISNNTSSGAINLAGNALVSAGTATFVKSGTGALNVANALNSATTPDGTTGGIWTVTGSNVNLSGGGNMLALTSEGTTTAAITGGNWTMTSTMRRNDTVAGVNNGPWGLSLGETNNSVTNFTISGATMNGSQGFLNTGYDSTGTLNITGGSSINFGFGPGAIGRFGILTGNGTLNVTGGSTLQGRLFEVGRVSLDEGGNSHPVNITVNVTGANSRINANQLVNRAEGNATINVNNGGLIDLTLTDAAGTGGAALLVLGGAAQGLTGEAVPSVAVMNIGAGGTIRSVQPQIGSELGVATVNVTGGGQFLQTPQAGTPTIGEAIFIGDADALGAPNDFTTGFGAFNVDGPGSTVNNSTTGGAVIVMGGGGGATTGGDALMNVTNGGNVTSNDLTIGQDEGSDAVVNVSGATSTVNIIPNGAGTIGSIVMAGNRGAGGVSTGRLNINGGTVSTGNIFIGGGFVDALGDPVPGGDATVTIATGGRLNVSGQYTMASVLQGQGTMNINGGVLNVGGNAFLSPSDELGSGAAPTARSVVNVNGGTWLNAGQLQVGGAGTLEGGSAQLNISNNGWVQTTGAGSNGLIAVFPASNGTLNSNGPVEINIGAGLSKGTLRAGGDVAVDSVINFNAGTFVTTGTLAVGGNVNLSSAARAANGTPTNKKLLEVGVATLTSSGVIDLNDNDMLIHDTSIGARQKYENFVRTARNNGAWNQPGITSTAAKNSSPQNKGLGVISGTEFQAANGGAGALFNGRTVAGSDTLIKFTFNGDTDLNGVVNFDDYARTDSGFNNNRTGWFNGDFDYNGIVNFDDYGLIDLAFNTQGGQVLTIGNDPAGPAANRTIVSAMAGSSHLAGMTADANVMSQKFVDGANGLQAVPEPGTIGVAGIALLGALARRRRSAR